VSLPLVSILIPTYNSEQWIAESIRSALAQTWERKEIIIVDDGSTDQTLQVARQFESESVRVVSQQNQGAAAARNKAFSLSHGDYIQWLDADDLLAADKIARQMEVVSLGEGPRTLLSSPWGLFIYRVHRAEFTPNALWCDLSPAEFLVRKLGQKIFMQTAVWLVSRELSEAAGSWDISLVSDDDGEYFCRVILASSGIRFVPDAKVYYRRVGTGRLSYVGRADNKLEAMWRSMQLHIGYLRSLEDSERVRAVCIQYLQNYLVVFYGQRPDIVDQMHEVARGLGGALRDPRLSWKYAWIKSLFGWSLAKRAQLFFPSVKWSVLRSVDRVQFSVEEKFSPKNKGSRVEDGDTASNGQIHARGQEAEVKQRRKSCL
jgi:glycosyltransferase involved in cell wall biosynthesis